MKSLTILSGKAMIVELKHKPIYMEIIHSGDLKYEYEESETGPQKYTYVNLPPGTWRIIGMLSEVTEDDVVNFTEVIKQHGCGKKLGYKDYNTVLDLYVDTALESLYSDIAANDYSFDTVLHKCECKPFTKEFEECPHINDSVTSCSVFEAQSRVLSRERCLLLRREG